MNATKLILMSMSTAAVFLSSEAFAETAQTDEIARNVIEATLPADLGVIDVDVPAAIEKLAPKRAELSVSWQRAPRQGLVSLKYVVSKNGKQTAMYGRVRLGARLRVLVATVALEAGTVVKAGDLGTATRTVTRGQGWQLSPSALVGSRILTDVTAGELISDKHVEAPAPVARGATVTVAINKGRLRVATRGVLERAARPGEEVAVRIAQTKKTIRTRLLSATEAVALETK